MTEDLEITQGDIESLEIVERDIEGKKATLVKEAIDRQNKELEAINAKKENRRKLIEKEAVRIKEKFEEKRKVTEAEIAEEEEKALVAIKLETVEAIRLAEENEKTEKRQAKIDDMLVVRDILAFALQKAYEIRAKNNSAENERVIIDIETAVNKIAIELSKI